MFATMVPDANSGATSIFKIASSTVESEELFIMNL